MLCFCWAFGLISAQTSFSVDTNYVSVSYPANSPVFYPWIVLTNNSGTELEMYCVKVLNQKPTGWETYLEDLDSAYNYVPDTSVFFLPAVNQQAQFIIVSFHPNNIVGRSTVVLKLYPANNPTDSVVLTFQGNARAVPNDTTAIGEPTWLPDLQLYPQPSAGALTLKSALASQITAISVVNLLGQAQPVIWQQNSADAIGLDVIDLTPGPYWLLLQGINGQFAIRPFVKQ